MGRRERLDSQRCSTLSMHLWQNILAYNRHDKPSQKKTFETFHNHIAPGSTLIHDKEQTHAKLIKVLALQRTVYASEELKGLLDLFSYVTNPPYDLTEMLC